MTIPARIYRARTATLAAMLDKAEAEGDSDLAAAIEEELDLRDLAGSDPAEIGARQAAQDRNEPLPAPWWEYR